MRNRLTWFAIPALVSAPGAVLAQVDTSEWLCESCPFESGYRAEYEAGGTYVTDDAARFGNATGYDQKGGYANVDGEGHYNADNYQLDWYLEDLGLDSRVAELEGGNQGSYGFYLGYRELPYRLFDTTRTIFTHSGGGLLTLPSGWVPAGSTSGMTQLASSLAGRNIESDRQIIDAGGHWLAGNRFKLYADYRRQNKEGVDIMAGAGYTQSSLLPRILDHSTDRIDAGLQYLLPKGNVTLAYYGSFFTNNISAMSWQDPFTASAGRAQPSMAQEPDNEFQQVLLSGHYRFDAWNQVVALSLAAGRGEQNQSFLPYTVNPALDTPLPRGSLDGKVDTANYAFTWTARPLDMLRLKAAYRYDDRDNTTAQSEWTRVIVDFANSGEVQENVPYSFRRNRANVSADLRLFDHWRFAAGYDYTRLERDFQEVAEQTEDSGWGQLRWQPAGWFDLRIKGGASKRDIDRYDTGLATSLGQNPLMRKYYLAYRYRTFAEAVVSASMTNMPLSFSASVFGTDDSYSRSQLGMTDAHEVRATADVTWTVSENSSIYLLYGMQNIEARQRGSAQFGAADWEAAHDDGFDNVGAGLVWRQLADRIDLRLDYTRGMGGTEIAISSVDGGYSQLPKLRSTLDSIRLEALYRLNERMEITTQVRFEQFNADDWALQDVAPNTLPTILTLDARPYDYDVWAIGVGFRYVFGDREVALVN